MSKQMRLFAYDEVREFNMPYYKRTYISEKADLSKNGYVDMVTERIQEIGEVFFSTTLGFCHGNDQ